MIRGILRKMIKPCHVFHNTFVALLQGEKLFGLHGHEPFGDVVGAKRVPKLGPGNLVTGSLDS